MKRFAACLLLANAGCATITTGIRQPIAVETDPPGAECTLTRNGRTLGKVTTPGTLTIEREGQPITVQCTKDGYEDGRTIMNSRAEPATYANAILGGFVGLAVDQATGANSRYEPNVKLQLTVMSEADRNYAEARKQSQAPPSPPVKATQSAPAPAGTGPAGPYDGSYEGSVQVLQTNVNPPIPHLRQFNVRVLNGVGTGTVKHVLCDQPGEVFFVVDTSGTIRGKANTRNTVGCTERMALLEGHMNGTDMTISLQLRGAPEFTMSREPGSAPAVSASAAAVPAASRSNDGDYRGGLELGAGDLRQVWLRVVGSKGTGNVRHASCRNPGLIAIDVASDGAVTGSADLLNGPACLPRKATVRGRLTGTQMVLNFVFDDGTTSRDFVFARQSNGFGVDN